MVSRMDRPIRRSVRETEVGCDIKNSPLEQPLRPRYRDRLGPVAGS
jgi:hypothetical protein